MGLITMLEGGGSVFWDRLNEPVSALAAAAFSKFLSPFAAYNLVVLLSFPLAAFFAYKFFKRFFDSWISLALSLVFTFSPYHILKIYNHIDLSQIWVFPLCFSALLDFDKDKSLKNTLKLGGLLALTTLISNYYGYFMLIIVGLFFSIRWFQDLKGGVLAQFTAHGLKSATTPYLLLTIFYLLLIVPFLFPYIKANYIGEGPVGVGDRTMIVGRGITDFAAFTARPWYFITPSVYHPVLGKFAEGVHQWFENTGYFLCDDFFAQEHSGIFLGWTNLILAALVILAPPRKTRRVTGLQPDGLGNRRRYLSTFLWLMSALAIFSGPPFFTVAGFKIYLPSYLLMKAFPMFRTLARLGVPILLCLLVLVGFALKSLKKKFSRFSNIQYLIFSTYLILALFEFYNPPTIVDVPERGSVGYNKLIEINGN